jgi:N-acetylmuramoyl-L-alanine amidase CwlA
MKPTRIVVHNTANDAPAKNEIAYMIRNNYETSFHYAVDDKEIVQGIEENRNAWHSSDGNGKGNREGIAIEICYSKSGGDRFVKAEQNAVELIVDILKRYGWGVDRVTKHQDYCGKYCPHRTLDMGWDRFIKMIDEKLNPAPAKKTVDELAREVIAGKWGNGNTRKNRLTEAGYNYSEVQAKVNEILTGKPAVAKKSVDEIAREVIRGKWGNGASRKKKLTEAGYNYAEVQAKVNQLLR